MSQDEITITTLSQNVEHIRIGDREILIVGTAHVSQESVDLAEQTIREHRPDAVALELCEARFQAIRDPERWKHTDIVAVVRSGKTFVLLAQLLLAAFQKKIGNKLDIKPGAEMLRAADVAEELGATLVMADRDVKVTLRRAWASIGTWTVFKLLVSVLRSLISSEEIKKEDIEKMKSPNVLNEALEEFSRTLPQIRAPLIDERDQYLTAKILASPGRRTIAVVGAGHVPGILRNLSEPIDVARLEMLPPAPLAGKVFAWGIPIIVVGMIVWGFFSSGFQTSTAMVKAWVMITGFSAAIGAALALGHPLTVIAAFVSAPFTTLHPILASGWVAGLVEAIIRKPRVVDLETVLDDATTMRGLWKNRVSRILLVVAFTNLTGTIGMIWGTKVVASLL